MGEHIANQDEEGHPQCPRCGHPYSDAARFCDQCGAARLVCEACGTSNSGGAKFCSNCGSPLEPTDAAPARAAGPVASAGGHKRATEVATAAPGAPGAARHAYTPAYLVERILTSRSALEGERKLTAFDTA
jgi:Double zinc ribbon